MPQDVLVVGATGTVGGALVHRLAREGYRVRAATRDPAAAAARQSQAAARFVEFDLERPGTFAPALCGVSRVFLIARPGDDDPDRVGVPLVDEMVRAGIRRVVNLSTMGAETREDFGLRRLERYLEASGLAFTHLRPNFFMQIFAGGPLLADIRTSGAIHVPAAQARLSFIDARDIAEVAAAALTSGRHEGCAYTLTGPEAIDHDAVAHAISTASGREVRYVAISEIEAHGALERAGLSVERADRLAGFYRMVRAGFCAPVSGDVESVLGRPATSFAQFAGDHAECWR
jgi:uncharacterized protein YbjT (DUF2867 family)